MVKRIYEASELPQEDKVYLRRDMFGWRTVQPIKNEDGSYNLANLLFGGWRNLIMLLFIVVVVLYHLHEDKLNLEAVRTNCDMIYDNPNGFCKAVCDNDNMKLKEQYNFSYKSILKDGVKEGE